MVCIPSSLQSPLPNVGLPTIPLIDPTFGLNPEGRIINAFNCLQQGGQAFINNIGLEVESCKGSLDAAIQAGQALGSGPGLGDLPAALGALSTASTALDEFTQHTNSIVDNMSGNMGVIKGALVARGSTGNGEDNPCAFVDDAIGSVGAKGSELLGGITDAISPIIDAISNGASAVIDFLVNNPVTDFVNRVADAALAITDAILREADTLLALAQETANYALTTAFDSIVKDPCLRAVTESVAGPCVRDFLAPPGA